MATIQNASDVTLDHRADEVQRRLLFDMAVDFNRSLLSQFMAGNSGNTGNNGFPYDDFPFAREVCMTSSANWSALSDGVQVNNIYTELRIILDVYVVIALCIIGFVGNALTIAVLRRDQVC